MSKSGVWGPKGKYGLNSAVVCLVCHGVMEISLKGVGDVRALFNEAEARHIHLAGHSPEAGVFVMTGDIESQVSRARGLYGVSILPLAGLEAFK